MRFKAFKAQVCANQHLRFSLIIFLCAFALSYSFIFPTPQHAQATTTLDVEEQAFLTLINNYRQQNGLSLLQASVTLTNASKWMSADMVAKNYFNHTDSLGRDPFVRMGSFGYNFNTYKGENIAAGYSDAASTFNQWKNSAGHNANMLDPNYKVVGIGRVANTAATYCYYWTTDFGGYVDQVISPTGNPTPTPIPTPTPTPAPVTVAILNPSFENGITSWTPSGYVYRTTSYVTNGSYAALLYANTGNSSFISQWLQLTAGATYEISGDFRNDPRNAAILGVKWENNAAGPLVQYNPAVSAGQGQTLKVRFTVPDGSGKVSVYIKATGSSMNFYWSVVDNLTIVRVN